MEINGGVGRRSISREMSPERSKTTRFASQKDKEKSLTAAAIRAQVVYYLSRNGQLEHPHFLEISHLPNQFLRLKDVIQRLTVLRGRGMPSLFSWSSKRSYKNSFVWNDLSENDIIYPADGAEYILKGSEIIHGCTPNSERFQHLQLSNKKTMEALYKTRQALEAEEEEQEEVEQEEMEKDASGDCTTSDHTAYTQCSPPSSSSPDKPPPESAAGNRVSTCRSDPVHLTRNSVLQFISCGSVAVKGVRAAAASAGAPATVKGRKSGESLEREAAELQCMSVNPRRVGNIPLEEKEYFSGSIVEAMAETGRVSPEPAMKKSNSYKEERGGKVGIGEEEERESAEGRVRGKCIPGMKRSSAKQKEQEQEEQHSRRSRK
ncbi:protein UPSTREAM OF FLC-like [Dendrobium catenatum]|uniref:SOSEKI DIX-like domain-containing protein n=1 Tax=Dendrobium catenatum TaxID=906689 RepID=A0A2I0W5F8_9ASPA|nr:protein UPSTREAM OF FLC-like [Dendrobium catenatum]PKU70899.1 hypothetical protein MA16_Dca019156 [Dendrobium catenatum]